MKSMCLVLMVLGLSKCAYSQFGFGGGFGGFGFGCYATLPTVGNQCYQPKQDSTHFCTARGSVYRHAPFYGDYSPYLAVDGQLSPGNSGFYHSTLEPYPALKISLVKADQITPVDAGKDINRVEIYQRCDANELYHRTSFDIRGDTVNTGEVYTAPRLVKGKICAVTTQGFTNGGTKFTVPCVPAVAAAFHVWIQKTTLHSTGAGWPGFNGNQWNSWTGSAPAQNTPNPVAFLMINEVVLY